MSYAARFPTTTDRTIGAIAGDEGTTFRVWAPDRASVELVLYEPGHAGAERATAESVFDVRALTREAYGFWTGHFPDVAAGARYAYRLDRDAAQTFPDPASRFQPDGVHAPSEVIDPRGFDWTDSDFVAPSREQLIFYELHVGTFSSSGTFLGVIDHLPHLVQLGVTAIELMPVADFPGRRNWGYDGVALFAPARCYGRPDELRALVDQAHGLGLACFLDVVYNHFGPDGAYANAFSSRYFSDAHKSPWGRGVNLDGEYSQVVRQFFIENALHWINEYHVDGLRLDATHELVDDSRRHFLAQLTETVRGRAQRPVMFVAEDHRNLARMLEPAGTGGFGIDAVWADDFHHELRVHAAGDHEGYYADYTGSAEDIARTIGQGWFFTGQYSPHAQAARGTDPSDLAPPQFVFCIQNHDQIGNRADGARLNHEIGLPEYRALTTLLLLVPETPLLFMGQEWAAGSPFLFFTNHNEELGRLVTAGRREEFRAFRAFADPARRAGIPDPQDENTFLRSRLDWQEPGREPHAGMLRLYRRLLDLRRSSEPLRDARRGGEFVTRAADPQTIVVQYANDNGGLSVVVRLGGGAGNVSLATRDANVLLTTEDEEFDTTPRPIAIERDPRVTVRFARAGAVVFNFSGKQ